ncbi:MAG: hypothetical protein AAF658_13195 [Myxococcota bacterium]
MKLGHGLRAICVVAIAATSVACGGDNVCEEATSTLQDKCGDMVDFEISSECSESEEQGAQCIQDNSSGSCDDIIGACFTF